MRTTLAIAIIGLMAGIASGQRLRTTEQETIRRTLDFASGNGQKVLEVDNIWGSIRVTGYDGRSVEMVANKTIRAQNQDRLAAAKQEVNLDIKDKADTISIYVDYPGRDRSTNSFSRSRWNDPGYEVAFDFEIRVPRAAAVRLWTINDGDIHLQNTTGDFLVNNVNGRVDVSGVSGSGSAKTINGEVKVKFDNNPRQESSFASINGDIEVTFQRNLSADLRFKTFNGGVYTDFPTVALATIPPTPERRNGKFVYKSNSFSGVRIGNGGPEMEFDGFNGDVRILQAK
jgi:hypothetical protein